MFKPQNKIIIVDDVKKDLDRLSKVFYDNGIGCKTFEYDSFEKPKLKDVRVAFFDININPSGGSSKNQIFNSVANAIEQYISIDNGLFALIFWTSKPEMVEEIKKFIQREKTDFPKPFFINHIAKEEVTTENLTNKLKQVLNEETLKLLFSFEEEVSIAANKTINQIYDIIPKDKKWGENILFKINFEKVFSKIAISTLGKEHAKENPEKAINESLLPIHNYNLIQNIGKENWKSFLTSINKNNLNYPVTFEEGKLNSIFHIEKRTGIINEKEIRGSVINIDKRKLNTLKKLKINNFDKWVEKIIPFNNDKDPLKHAKIEEIKTNVYSNVELIAIELSAACDYSQKKERINKYILGLIVPKFDQKKASIDKVYRSESSYHIGGCDFNFDGSDFQIWLNLNFVFGTTTNDKRFGDVKFILKKEMMDMIGNKYASHVSRIGITSF
jgi:hypothetical protein